MRRNLLTAIFSLALIFFRMQTASAEIVLTSVETKWLNAAQPVLSYAQAQGLPVDVVVQTNNQAGDVPFAMGVRDGRCKLVLSMRGNPDAETTLVDVPLTQQSILIETMTAHEMAHCWRFVHGEWHALPAGFVEARLPDENEPLAKQKQQMRATRREEGYADLVGLAWMQREHPAEYPTVYAWLIKIRSDQPLVGSYHDTRVWLLLAKDASVFAASKNPFEQVANLWATGLRLDN